MHIYDLIGIGFGPSNIALAIALDEKQEAGLDLNVRFIEKQPSFAWHRHMLLDSTNMQISFLKDLCTLRNPLSRFTFINYLHQKNRLQDFINLKTFFPSRHEFNDYLTWAADEFGERCVYGEEVFEVAPEGSGDEVDLLRVRSRDSAGRIHERLARHIAISIGGAANVPDHFQKFKDDPRVLHSSSYLRDIGRHAEAKRIAIVGAGQSAAEIFVDLHNRPGAPGVDLISRARAIHPSDDSPFVNEIFNADFTDYMYSRSDQARTKLLDEFWHTNYAAPDRELVEKIFKVFYEQKVSGQARHRFLRRHEVLGAKAVPDGIQITLFDLDTQRELTACYDAVVLATGYTREHYRTMLAPLASYLDAFTVDRTYRLNAPPAFRPGIFLQGACEASHGLSDTLLSITAIRSEEIVKSLLTVSNLDAEPRPLRMPAISGA